MPDRDRWPMCDETPNFLYIGTSKAGSTWLFNTLAIHPEVYLASSKGLYYFDQHFDRSREWYLSHFEKGGDLPARGEISHSYLSSPEAPSRIADLNPDMRLIVCLREPVDRAFSDYLDLVKNLQYDGPFESALEKFPRLVQRGMYATHLERYLEHFPRAQVHVGLFDDLQLDAQRYANDTFRFLGVGPLTLPAAALKRRMPAGTARNPAVAAAAKKASKLVLKLQLRRLRSAVKRSTLARQVLYRPFEGDRPTIDAATARGLRSTFAGEVAALDALVGTPVSSRWGYPKPD
jgi:hypothetical protein